MSATVYLFIHCLDQKYSPEIGPMISILAAQTGRDGARQRQPSQHQNRVKEGHDVHDRPDSQCRAVALLIDLVVMNLNHPVRPSGFDVGENRHDVVVR